MKEKGEKRTKRQIFKKTRRQRDKVSKRQGDKEPMSQKARVKETKRQSFIEKKDKKIKEDRRKGRKWQKGDNETIIQYKAERPSPCPLVETAVTVNCFDCSFARNEKLSKCVINNILPNDLNRDLPGKPSLCHRHKIELDFPSK